MQHVLKLFIRDGLDTRFIVITDISRYENLVPVSNDALYIQLPGFDDAVLVPSVKGKTASYSSLELLPQCTDTELKELPDGLYTITYSVAPNSKVNTTVYHYRAAKLQKEILGLIAGLSNCPDPHATDACGNVILEKTENVLLKALLILESLQTNLCEFGDYQAAKDSYSEAAKMIAALNKEC